MNKTKIKIQIGDYISEANITNLQSAAMEMNPAFADVKTYSAHLAAAAMDGITGKLERIVIHEAVNRDAVTLTKLPSQLIADVKGDIG